MSTSLMPSTIKQTTSTTIEICCSKLEFFGGTSFRNQGMRIRISKFSSCLTFYSHFDRFYEISWEWENCKFLLTPSQVWETLYKDHDRVWMSNNGKFILKTNVSLVNMLVTSICRWLKSWWLEVGDINFATECWWHFWWQSSDLRDLKIVANTFRHQHPSPIFMLFLIILILWCAWRTLTLTWPWIKDSRWVMSFSPNGDKTVLESENSTARCPDKEYNWNECFCGILRKYFVIIWVL